MGINPNVTRRNFLSWYMAGLMTATVLAGAAPILLYIWPPPPRGQKEGDVPVTPQAPVSGLQEGQVVSFEAPQNSGFFMVDGGGDNARGDVAYAGFAVKIGQNLVYLAVNCSHLGCSVGYNQDKHRFECPCHGSMFNPDGTVLHGPAAFPLSHLAVTAQGNQLMVKGFTQTGGA